MRRMLTPGAVALALVATLGVHEASAQKPKENRVPGNPLRVNLQITNLTTNQQGKDITAAAGDEVSIRLRVDNRTGEAQSGVVHVIGGIPGCIFEQTVVEFFELGQRKEATVTGFVPEGQSGLFTVDVDVLMPKTSDTKAASGSVAFGGALKGEAASGGFMHRLLLQTFVRALVALKPVAGAPVSVSEFKVLYR